MEETNELNVTQIDLYTPWGFAINVINSITRKKEDVEKKVMILQSPGP
jgi:hypothetical protein